MGQTDNNTNGNVSVLQRFLVSQGYLIVPAGATGGFFGSLTQAAVVAFQNQYGIQPTGIVGQYTLNAISSVCNGNGSTGKAPFTFTGSVSGATATFTLSGVSNNTSVTHVVAFGDNTNSQMTYQGSNGSTGTWTVSHTYAQPGTYTATLLVQTNICGGVQAYGCVSDLQTGSTVVTVSSGSAVPASPASGSGAACQEVSGGSCQGAGGTYPNYSAETLTDISGNSGVFGVNNEVLFSCVNGVWMCGGSSCSTAIDIGDTAANGYQTAVDYTQGGSYMYSSTSGLTMCTAN
jgi:peptidoglycan hydrolase-like protein with peptidoglycan-binding domain